MARKNSEKNTLRAQIKRRQNAGNVQDLQLRMWRAVEAAEECLFSAAKANDRDGVLKAVYAISSIGGSYAKVVEIAELEARIAELEAQREAPASAPIHRLNSAATG